jgi:hypothetical protein
MNCSRARVCERAVAAPRVGPILVFSQKKLRKSAVKSLKEFDRVNLCASIAGRTALPRAALQSLLHRARDFPDALFDQRRCLADVSDGLVAIVEDAKIP